MTICEHCGCREALAGNMCPNCDEYVEIIHYHKYKELAKTKMILTVENGITHWKPKYHPKKTTKPKVISYANRRRMQELWEKSNRRTI